MTLATPQSKRRSKSIIVGKVLCAVGPNMYKVRFITGEEIDCESCKLKVISGEDVPPSLRPATSEVNSDVSSVSDDDGIINDPSEEEEEEMDASSDNSGNENSQDTIESNLRSSSNDENNDNDSPDDEELTYQEKLMAAREKVMNLTGDTVEKRHKNNAIIWRVIEQHVCETQERSDIVCGLKQDVLTKVMEKETMIASEIFMRLMFGGNLVENVVQVNQAIQRFNEENNRNISLFTNAEFLRGMGCLIGSVCFSANGNQLWNKETANDVNGWVSIEPNAEFYKYMPKYRFKEFRQFLPTINEDRSKENSDPWWRYVGGVDSFNLNRLKYVVSSNHISMDELMSAWRPRKTKTGGLPNITNIPRKPKPLGTEKKCTSCSSCKVMLHMEIQRGKDEMKKQKYNLQLGATAACTVRLAEER